MRMKTQSDLIPEALKFLGGVRLFSDLNETSMNLLARASRFQRVEKGEILFFQSDPSELA